MARLPELPPATAISSFTRFRAFWHEVDAARAGLPGGAPVAAPVPGALVHAENPVRTRLLAILKTQDAEVARLAGGSAPPTYREAHYLMAALADDVFLRLSWDGAASWMWRPLELELYGTRCAGRLVFERIDRLMAAADPDRELAAIYLIALSLGFEGQFAGRSDRTRLQQYHRQLRELIAGERDTLDRPLVPDCYAHTMVLGRGPLLQDVRAWGWAAAIVAAVWLIGSTLAWRHVSAPVAAVAFRVDAATGQGTR